MLLQGVLQLVLGLLAAALCSLQLPQKICTPATNKTQMCRLEFSTAYGLAIAVHRMHLTYATSLWFHPVSIPTAALVAASIHCRAMHVVVCMLASTYV